MEGGKKIMVKSPIVLYKNLVFGVIILLIGVGIQPAFAKVQPDIVNFKLRNNDKEELTVKINEMLQKYGHIPIVSFLCKEFVESTFVLTWISLLLYAIFVGVGLFLYVLFKFYYYYY